MKSSFFKLRCGNVISSNLEWERVILPPLNGYESKLQFSATKPKESDLTWTSHCLFVCFVFFFQNKATRLIPTQGLVHSKGLPMGFQNFKITIYHLIFIKIFN